MKCFSVKDYDINVIEPMDKYGEGKMHFSEIPLVELKNLAKTSLMFNVGEFLTLDKDIVFNDGSVLAQEDIICMQEKIFKAFPDNYLNLFVSLAKNNKPKM